MGSTSASGWALLSLFVIAAVYLAALMIATHVPFTVTPQGNPYSIDKWLHAAAFAVLGALVCAAVAAWLGASWKVFAATFVCVAAYRALDEYTQSLIANRAADFYDWLADVIGAALGVACFAFLHSWLRPKT